MVKIRVSYERPEELGALLLRLSPLVVSCREAKEQKGPYKRVYIILGDIEKRSE